VPPEIRKLREQAQKHPKGSHKRERAQQQLRQIEGGSNPKRKIVGASIQIPGYTDIPIGERLKAVKHGGYRSAWLQRGHWRNQPHGLGWKSQDGVIATEAGKHLTWIRPQVKRRDLGLPSDQHYTVR
jgi:hypothetical protein